MMMGVCYDSWTGCVEIFPAASSKGSRIFLARYFQGLNHVFVGSGITIKSLFERKSFTEINGSTNQRCMIPSLLLEENYLGLSAFLFAWGNCVRSRW